MASFMCRSFAGGCSSISVGVDGWWVGDARVCTSEGWRGDETNVASAPKKGSSANCEITKVHKMINKLGVSQR